MTVFLFEQPGDKLWCPRCGTGDVTRKAGHERVFRSLTIGDRPTLVHLDVG